VNNEANKVVRTQSNGYTYFGWINTTSGNAGSTAMDRIYASYDSFLRYYTPAEFANQILALGSVKNSHTHAASEITSGTLATARGGTGLSSFTSGSYFYASSSSTISQRTSAQVLSDIGAAPVSHTHDEIAGLTMRRYASTFAGAGSSRIVYISGFSSTNYSVSITPTSNPGGHLGEVYVSKSIGYFYVYNTGTSTVGFDASVIGTAA
jgi:hypothetical protein